jgi:hypothetical protein
MVENPHLSIRTEQQSTTRVTMVALSPSPLWKHLNPQERKQLAQLLAELVRRTRRQAPNLKVSYDER